MHNCKLSPVEKAMELIKKFNNNETALFCVREILNLKWLATSDELDYWVEVKEILITSDNKADLFVRYWDEKIKEIALASRLSEEELKQPMPEFADSESRRRLIELEKSFNELRKNISKPIESFILEEFAKNDSIHPKLIGRLFKKGDNLQFLIEKTLINAKFIELAGGAIVRVEVTETNSMFKKGDDICVFADYLLPYKKPDVTFKAKDLISKPLFWLKKFLVNDKFIYENLPTHGNGTFVTADELSRRIYEQTSKIQLDENSVVSPHPYSNISKDFQINMYESTIAPKGMGLMYMHPEDFAKIGTKKDKRAHE